MDGTQKRSMQSLWLEGVYADAASTERVLGGGGECTPKKASAPGKSYSWSSPLAAFLPCVLQEQTPAIANCGTRLYELCLSSSLGTFSLRLLLFSFTLLSFTLFSSFSFGPQFGTSKLTFSVLPYSVLLSSVSTFSS